jgi:hypothetical protein
MTPLQLELTRLIGKKEYGVGLLFTQAYTDKIETMLSEVRWGNFHAITWDKIHFPHTSQITEIIGHPATLSDLHMWINSCNRIIDWSQNTEGISVTCFLGKIVVLFYDSSKELINQNEKHIKDIVYFIKNHS